MTPASFTRTVGEPLAAIALPAGAIDQFDPLEALETENDTPVDTLLQEKLQRILVQILYSAFRPGVPFLAAADVALYSALGVPPLVPDVLLSLGVAVPADWSQKQNRSYFTWIMGKPPDLAVEIVSNRKGGELDRKLDRYAAAGVKYYAIYDPLNYLAPTNLQAYALSAEGYQALDRPWFESLGLGLVQWQGQLEGSRYPWLRWCDAAGNLLLTGDEQADQQRQRADRLERRLRALGIDPDAE